MGASADAPNKKRRLKKLKESLKGKIKKVKKGAKVVGGRLKTGAKRIGSGVKQKAMVAKEKIKEQAAKGRTILQEKTKGFKEGISQMGKGLRVEGEYSKTHFYVGRSPNKLSEDIEYLIPDIKKIQGTRKDLKFEVKKRDLEDGKILLLLTETTKPSKLATYNIPWHFTAKLVVSINNRNKTEVNFSAFFPRKYSAYADSRIEGIKRVLDINFQ